MVMPIVTTLVGALLGIDARAGLRWRLRRWLRRIHRRAGVQLMAQVPQRRDVARIDARARCRSDGPVPARSIPASPSACRRWSGESRCSKRRCAERRSSRCRPRQPKRVQPIAAPAAPLREPVEQAAVPVAEIEADAVPARDATAGTAQPPLPQRVPSIPAYAAARTASATREPSALWRWIAGGNTLARVGVVVLFIGVAFLLKYATEHVSVPIEVRLAAVALGGIVLLVLGWRLRASRTGYAMSLQGAAVGILYLTVFAALRLYQLLPPVAAVRAAVVDRRAVELSSPFARTRCRSPCSASSAASRAPILTSTGGGSHVMLFSYYVVLNAGDPRHRVVQGVAAAEPRRLRVHVRSSASLWGVDALPARGFRDDGAVPDPVLPVLRRDRDALCAAQVARGQALRRCDARVRHAARRRGPAKRPDAACRVRAGVERHRRVARLHRARPFPVRAASRRPAPARRGFPGARRRVRDAGGPARARCAARRPRRGRSKARRWSGSACASNGWRRARSALRCRWRPASRSGSDSPSGRIGSSAARCPC